MGIAKGAVVLLLVLRVGITMGCVDDEDESCSKRRSTSSLKSPNSNGGDLFKSSPALFVSRRLRSVIMTTGGRLLLSFLAGAELGCGRSCFLVGMDSILSGVGRGSVGFE